MHSYKKIDFSNYAEIIDDLLLDVPRSALLAEKSTPVTTMGSCFATNLSNAMCKLGWNSEVISITEHQNTPFLNRLLMDFIVHGSKSKHASSVSSWFTDIFAPSNFEVNKDADEYFDPDTVNNVRQRTLERIRNTQVFVLTLGVGFVWRNKGDNSLLIDGTHLDRYVPDFLSPGKQAQIVKDTLDLLRLINRKMAIFITVSPVPLLICTAPKSQIVSDCLSKSILRVAAHEAAMACKDVFYFPSFEFFRWVSGHHNRAFFGSDGKVRHPDADMVELIVSKFIQLNGGDIENAERLG